jgi:hypothetical protein
MFTRCSFSRGSFLFFQNTRSRSSDAISGELKLKMPPNAKSLAARLREKRKRGFQEPKEAVNEAADPTYFGPALPYLANEALDVINTTVPLTSVFALNAGDPRGSSPQAFTSGFCADSGFCDQTTTTTTTTTTTQLQPDSEKSPQNAQAFRVAQSSGAPDDIIVDDGLDLDPDLEVRQLTYLLFVY